MSISPDVVILTMSRWPDPLAGLNWRQRLAKEQADAQYIHAHADIYANAEARKVAAMTYAGTSVLKPSDLKDYDAATFGSADIVICARYDMEHPLYYTDNLSASCADCGCDLQVRPHAPAGERVCISCGARRVAQEVAQPADDAPADATAG